MSGIVSNATPLIYLAKVKKIDLLRRVFSEVFIPEEVRIEIVDKGKTLAKKEAYIIERAIHDGWIKVISSDLLEVPIKLHSGEVAVLSLAKKLGVKEVLVDEVSARTAARLLNLTPRGTIYILLKSLESKALDLNGFLEVLNGMIEHGYRLREEVYIESIKEAQKISKSIKSRRKNSP